MYYNLPRLTHLSRIEQQGGFFGSMFVLTKYLGEIPAPGNHASDGDENVTCKLSLGCLKLHCSFAIPFILSNVGKFFPGVTF